MEAIIWQATDVESYENIEISMSMNAYIVRSIDVISAFKGKCKSMATTIESFWINTDDSNDQAPGNNEEDLQWKIPNW